MHVDNAVSCEPDDTFGRGALRARVFDLTERLGASVIDAAVWEVRAGEKLGPYHFHHGVEEWLYVVSGAPLLRDRGAERPLEPGTSWRSAPVPPARTRSRGREGS